MTHTDAANTKDVSLACVLVRDSVGVIITQSAYIKFYILPKFIRSVSYSVASNILLTLINNSVQQPLEAVSFSLASTSHRAENGSAFCFNPPINKLVTE